MAFRSLILSMLAMLAVPVAASGADRTFTVGTASASAGQSASGVIHVPAGVDAGYDIPVIVIHGRSPGPTLALVAGLHGAEFGGIVSLPALAKDIDPKTLRGSIIIIPAVNVASFHMLTRRLNPVDGKNLNRSFPGDPAGTQSQRAAAILSKDVLSRADYVVDYHNGDLDEDQIPYSYWIVTGDQALNAKEHEMLLAYSAPYIVRFDFAAPAIATAKMLPTQAVARGKPAITVEAGRAGSYTAADLKMTVEGTERVMAKLGMIETAPPPPTNAPVPLSGTITINSEATGVFFPAVARGDHVTKGEKLGRITDFYGRILSEPTAPESGVILYLNSTPSAVMGEQLFFLGLPEA